MTETHNYAQIRQHLIGLIRKCRRTAVFTRKRPTDIRFWEILNPESGFPLTDVSMWHEIVRLLKSGVSLQEKPLDQPPDEKAWVFRARLAPGEPRIYVKLQILGSGVLLRSFHRDEHEYD